MKITNQILAETGAYVSGYLSKHLDKAFCYHDFFHTFSVVNASDMLCTTTGISKPQQRILLVAAWFHDTGYTIQMDEHEKASAIIAEKFLKERGIDEEEIELVKNCILATQYPQHPKNELEQILCDADMLHLSADHFMERSALLRKEWDVTKNQQYTDKEWCELNIAFLNNHEFHTGYCRELFDKVRKVNLKQLTDALELYNKQATKNNKEKNLATSENKKTEKIKEIRLERGVETLFRLTSGNHMKLSGMADTKAHILLSINSIIISVILSVLVKNLHETPNLIVPTIFLLAVCLATTVFAVLTTKPKISKGVFTADQIHNRQANLLFFGNFHNMGWESYEWGIQEIMHDREYLYKSMTKDIYYLGKVLAAKYRYLNIGYRIFMYGMIASVLAFAISFIWA
jgi:predicted metal-dependent HD superfamily phosphohydrolase